MKTLVGAFVFCFMLGICEGGRRGSGNTYKPRGTGSNYSYTRTKGYVKKSGTYVAPSYKSKSNKTQYDNWSTRGNQNPFTGKEGTRTPEK
jgi:hypothetical protein